MSAPLITGSINEMSPYTCHRFESTVDNCSLLVRYYSVKQSTDIDQPAVSSCCLPMYVLQCFRGKYFSQVPRGKVSSTNALIKINFKVSHPNSISKLRENVHDEGTVIHCPRHDCSLHMLQILKGLYVFLQTNVYIFQKTVAKQFKTGQRWQPLYRLSGNQEGLSGKPTTQLRKCHVKGLIKTIFEAVVSLLSETQQWTMEGREYG